MKSNENGNDSTLYQKMIIAKKNRYVPITPNRIGFANLRMFNQMIANAVANCHKPLNV